MARVRRGCRSKASSSLSVSTCTSHSAGASRLPMRKPHADCRSENLRSEIVALLEHLQAPAMLVQLVGEGQLKRSDIRPMRRTQVAACEPITGKFYFCYIETAPTERTATTLLRKGGARGSRRV